ncbi:hypothetical protein AYX15_07032, partial [Cryptococcus neoformans]
MPSNNLASLLSLASASSRIRESQHPQITTASDSGSKDFGVHGTLPQAVLRVRRQATASPEHLRRRHQLHPAAIGELQ